MALTLLRDMDVVLINRTQSDTDPFGNPVFTETETTVHHVLVAPATADDLVNVLGLDGKKEVYKLGLPKGDTHTWQDQDVRFFGKRYHIFSPVTRGIEENVPTPWHHIYFCERYE